MIQNMEIKVIKADNGVILEMFVDTTCSTVLKSPSEALSEFRIEVHESTQGALNRIKELLS